MTSSLLRVLTAGADDVIMALTGGRTGHVSMHTLEYRLCPCTAKSISLGAFSEFRRYSTRYSVEYVQIEHLSVVH